MKFILIFIETFLYTQDSFILQNSDEEISIIPICKSCMTYLTGVIANLKGRKLKYIECDVNEA